MLKFDFVAYGISMMGVLCLDKFRGLLIASILSAGILLTLLLTVAGMQYAL